MIIDNGINEETILHVWNWSFKTIKENIKEIVNAGYTWIQISPVQGTKDKSLVVKDWWMLYQPINFKIGNFQIGSRSEFIEMCAEAHRYGLKVMVDVILNQVEVVIVISHMRQLNHLLEMTLIFGMKEKK